jgi:hypothetical protein
MTKTCFPYLDIAIIGYWAALCVWIAYTPAQPKPPPTDPPAYCYSNARGMGTLCSTLKGEFNV